MVRKKKGGVFSVNYTDSVVGFSSMMQKFPLKRILYKTILRGKGLEFDSYRVFQQDDDASMIDWRASLRSNTLLAKKYIEERELNIYFIVDASSNVLFGSGDKLKAEFNAEIVAALGYLILESGDKIGLVMVNDDIIKYVPPKNGKNQFMLLTSFLSNPSFYKGEFNLKKGVDFLLDIVKNEYSLFIILSDFIAIKKGVQKSLKFLGSKFETLALFVRDPIDVELPMYNHQISIRDPQTGRQMIVDPKLIAEKYKLSALKQKKSILRILNQANIDTCELDCSESFFYPLYSFLKQRSRGDRI
ncbi:MAG: DUF58 domain-containing protein [Bacilli bacterium]